jgi:flagellar biosynthesis protein FlhA
MGFIDQAEAQRRRRGLEREASFYGAMDGASKFVKGDAIAGILILLVNIVGGLVIGVVQRGMSWQQALQTFTLLTVGDGIVTQVPALVIAVGTGIIVTRSAADGNLGHEALRQVTSFPKTLLLVALALAGLVVLPGIPALPALFLLALVLATAWVVRKLRAAGSGEVAAAAQDPGAEPLVEPAPVEPIEVLVGARWAPEVAAGGLFAERIAAFRAQHAQDYGLVLPRIRFREAARLPPDGYEIHVDGALAARGETRHAQWLAIHPAGDLRSIPGESTRDPTYGLPALWIAGAHREAAAAARFTLVDPATVFLTHLTEVLRRESASLLSRAETDKLLARVRQAQPALVEEVVPALLSAGDVQKVLQNLLREKVSIRHLEAILETLADAGRSTKDPAQLTEAVRRRLGPVICQSLANESAALHVLTLDAAIESRFLQTLQGADAMPLVLEPKLLDKFLLQLVQQAEKMMKSNLLPVLLCAPELRRHVRLLAERPLPHLRVVSMAEVPHGIELKSFATVSA